MEFEPKTMMQRAEKWSDEANVREQDKHILLPALIVVQLFMDDDERVLIDNDEKGGDDRIDNIEETTDKLRDQIENQLAEMDKMNERLEKYEKRINELETTIDELGSGDDDEPDENNNNNNDLEEIDKL